MKTPREILLERHRAAGPKLDSIRHEIVTAEFKSVGQAARLSPTERMKKLETGASPVLRLLWRELIWPSRHVWSGLAVVWAVILTVNFSAHDPERIAGKSPPPAREIILTLPQQEQLLAELVGPGEPRVAGPPKPFSPRPSSERRFEILTV